jgi:hypothetical protein
MLCTLYSPNEFGFMLTALYKKTGQRLGKKHTGIITNTNCRSEMFYPKFFLSTSKYDTESAK